MSELRIKELKVILKDLMTKQDLEKKNNGETREYWKLENEIIGICRIIGQLRAMTK